MIQIDDAGSGSLVGGTCIGAVRKETGEFHFDFIPIEYYKKPYFQAKLLSFAANNTILKTIALQCQLIQAKLFVKF